MEEHSKKIAIFKRKEHQNKSKPVSESLDILTLSPEVRKTLISTTEKH